MAKSEIWTEEENEFIKNNMDKMTFEEMAVALNRTPRGVQTQRMKLGLSPRRKWTQEEIDYLEEMIGKRTFKQIAKDLNRTIQAIVVKATRLGISNTKVATGKLSAFQLGELLGLDGKVVLRWVEKHGLKGVKKVTRLEAKVVLIEPNDFWKWAYTNKDKLNFSKIEPMSIVPEPEWVEFERKKDYHQIPRNDNLKWTPKEDELLKLYVIDYKYTYKEVGKIMGRSPKGIQARWKRIVKGLVDTPVNLRKVL